MSKALIEKLRGNRTEFIRTAETFITRMEAGETLTPTETANLTEAQNTAAEFDTRIAELITIETARMDAARRDTEFDNAAALTSEVVGRPTASTLVAEQTKTLGDLFVESEVFKEFAERKTGTSALFTAAVQFARINSTDVNGRPLAGVHRASDAMHPQHSTPLLDACGFEPVSSGAFDYISWPAVSPAAGVVAEGAAKPEAVYAPVVMVGVLEKMAHHIPITSEFLEDAPRMKAIVDNALVNGVRDKAEAQAGAALVAAATTTAEGGTLLKAIRVGIALGQNNGFRADTVVVNPLDYADIDIELLERTLNGARRESPVWGLNVVAAGAVPAGTAYTGPFGQAMTVYAKSGVTVKMTDSHAAEFINNTLRVLAEQRVLTVVTRPEAIKKCVVVAPAAEPGPETTRKTR